jgi:uncharacterized protein involved in outer membrane biogenesis
MKKLGRIGIVLLVLALVGAGIAFFVLRGRSSGELATWLGKQIVGIASSYIEPTIDFRSVDYKAPYSVTLNDVTLKAADGTTVAAVRLLRVELAELPAVGKPIQIKSVILERPALTLIKTSGGFKGLVPFVKATPGMSDQAVDPNFRVSNVFRLRELRLSEGSVSYDQSDGSPKMELDGLNLNLDVSPESGAGAGWYAVKTTMGRKPQAVIDLDGSVNIDTLMAKFARLGLEVRVGPDTIAGLPPEVQNLVKAHDATGDLKISASGEAVLTDPLAGTMDVGVELSGFNIAFGEFKLPIDSARVNGRLDGGVFTLAPSGADLLKGKATFDGTLGLGQSGRPAALNWTLANIDMRETLRVQTPEGVPPPYAGILSGGGAVRTSLDAPTGAMSGNGNLALRQGRLTGLPAIQQLAAATDLMGRISPSLRFDHTADVAFGLEPRGMNISELTITTEFIGIKGDGIVGFDRSLDLTVSAGPVEKLAGLLGKNQVSKLIGDIAGGLVKYRIGGVIGSPTVKVDPLGLRGK